MSKKGNEIIFAFDSLLRNYPDSEEFVSLFRSFMIHAFRIKNECEDIPIAEMMVVLRHKKPKITSQLKEKDNMILKRLLKMDVDYKKAETQLQRVVSESLSNSFRCS